MIDDGADTTGGPGVEREIMHINNTRWRGRLGLAIGAAAALTAIGVAAASPAVAATSASVANGTLTVTGSSGRDVVVLRLVTESSLRVEINGTTAGVFDLATFGNFVVLLGNGDDQFSVEPPTALAGKEGTIDGGNGRDLLNGSAAVELFIGGNGKDAVDGNRGDDRAELGTGTDSFRWDPGDGSDEIDGGTGIDTLDFNGAGVSEQMRLFAAGELAIFFRQQATIRMEMTRVERLDLDALGGADDITIDDMSGTDFRRADVDLSATGNSGGGDGASDCVQVNGTANADHIKVKAHGTRVDVEGLQTETRVTGAETGDRLHVDGRGGNDKIEIDPDVSTLISLSNDPCIQPQQP